MPMPRLNLATTARVRVDTAYGVYLGIRLNVSGLIKPGAPSPAPAQAAPKPPANKGQFLFLTKAVRELNRVQVTLPPELDLDFNLDLTQPLASHVVAKFRGSHLQYR